MPLKINSFFPLNFAITKIRVEIRLAEDGTRMGGMQFQLFPSITLLRIFTIQFQSCFYS